MPNRPTDEIDLGEAGDYRSALRELSEEFQKLRQLRELYALKVANRCQRKEVESIKAQVKRTHSELLQLMLEVEHLRERSFLTAAVHGCEPWIPTLWKKFRAFSAAAGYLNAASISAKETSKDALAAISNDFSEPVR